MNHKAWLLAAVAALAHAEDTRRSGLEYMSAATQALQRDDLQNPALLWLKDGEQRYADDCARCHDGTSMRGVATHYPAFDAALSRPVTLAERINLCRTRHVKAAAWPAESQPLLALETFVANASRGLPIAPPDDPKLAPFRAEGEAMFKRREGQLNLSCANCHDDNAGRKLAGATIPEAHPTAYPVYRSEWQTVGSLQRRLRNCLIGMRTDPYAYDSRQYLALEVYLMERARGLKIEAPGIRP